MTCRHRLDIARTHTMADAARSEPMGFIQVEAAPRQALKRAGCLILLARQRRLGQLTRRRTRSEPLDYARALSHWSQFIFRPGPVAIYVGIDWRVFGRHGLSDHAARSMI